jgi:Leucine-rich repeat (LRR) protein
MPQDICKLRIEASLRFLWADCAPALSTNSAKISCPIENCCTICFEGRGNDDDLTITGGSSPHLTANTPQLVETDKILELKKMLFSVANDGGASLKDDTSPQFRAYTWLAQDSANGKYTDEQLLQRYALGTLFFATNGMNWVNTDNWLGSSDELTWYGVMPGLGANIDKIVAIELAGNRLHGTIPPEIFEFIPTIENLHLSSNELAGPIPKEIGMLQKIKVVELAYNQLTSIPSEMGNLHTIESLLLEGNDFGGQLMPTEICALVNSGSLTMLHADCLGDDASLKCSSTCCTTCF